MFMLTSKRTFTQDFGKQLWNIHQRSPDHFMLWHTHYTGSTFSPAKTLFVASCVRCTREAHFHRLEMMIRFDWVSSMNSEKIKNQQWHCLWGYDQLTNYLESIIYFWKDYCVAPGGPTSAIFATNGYDPLNFEVGIFLLHIWSWMFATVCEGKI